MNYAVNVIPRIFSKKVVNNGLKLLSSNTFSPINTLTTIVHLDKLYSVFIHKFIVYTENKETDLYSKLLINDYNVGSLIHGGKEIHKIK